ncbi:hypothetical protein I302_107719 [Kwoniella bestiolae CBS 10118]|uniref:Uncharacterized protein n=1 Tax=Kwoniella bestiolae CBS 10118 TaxID=1296100 RepID=A0A1B9FXR3_9TREE|nr:hypothetical protein I302_06542 [Kwoniella bestiolae CBS 10118]OCF23559.1 hypothetical protein I302_06542 [Kwoniella bestiolae CBS 10118]
MALTAHSPEYVKSLFDPISDDEVWPGALYQAPIITGIVHDPEGQGGMPNMFPMDAMKLLTGKKGEMKEFKNIDELWETVHHVNDSPMVLISKPEDCAILTANIWYAILKAEGALTSNGDDRIVHMVNTYNERSTISLKDLYRDTYYVAYWIDFPSFRDVGAP